jgi:hypothetical protein
MSNPFNSKAKRTGAGHDSQRRPPAPQGPADFAAQMARAEFGRFYVDGARIEQTLQQGAVVFRDKRSRHR